MSGITNMAGRTHAECLPEIRASNEAWRAEHLSRLRALQAERDERRSAGNAALNRIDEADRAAIIAAYGGRP